MRRSLQHASSSTTVKRETNLSSSSTLIAWHFFYVFQSQNFPQNCTNNFARVETQPWETQSWEIWIFFVSVKRKEKPGKERRWRFIRTWKARRFCSILLQMIYWTFLLVCRYKFRDYHHLLAGTILIYTYIVIYTMNVMYCTCTEFRCRAVWKYIQYNDIYFVYNIN